MFLDMSYINYNIKLHNNHLCKIENVLKILPKLNQTTIVCVINY